MDKQRNRDNRRKKQNLELKRNCRTTTPKKADAPFVRSLNSINGEIEVSSDDDDPYGLFEFVNTKLVQSISRFGDNPEEDINSANDFQQLANATLTDGYFQFKSEKNWTVDISKYSELLAIDVKNLAMVFNSIPFNEFIEVDDKYFTRDLLTLFRSQAEQSEKVYQAELLEKEKQLEIAKQRLRDETTSNKDDDSDSGGSSDKSDDLDFLLSLKEPAKANPVNTAFSLLKINEEPKASSSAPNTKSVDLEKWLDSVLDL